MCRIIIIFLLIYIVLKSIHLFQFQRPRGGIGRHKGLKILALFGSAGSSPAEGTTIMRILSILLLLASCSKDVKVPFISKDFVKPVNVMIENEFDITYSLSLLATQNNDVCQMSLEIKNISKEEKRNSLSIDVYSFADKKYEAFVVEKKSKPNEVVNTTVKFNGINCEDIRKINFYK